MELIERYLTEVEANLPSTQRNDIVTELRDNLVEQVQGIADEGDRAPTPADERAVLGSLGHPLKLASSYKPRRYLIGPALYPAYVRTMQTALGAIFTVIVLLVLVFGSTDSVASVVEGVLNGFFEAGLWVVGMVTLSYLALESSGSGVGWYDNWKPEDLRPSTSPIVYSDVISNLVAEGFFLLWWNGLILTLGDSVDSGEFRFSLTGIWQELFWPLNGLFGASFALHLLVLVGGCWRRWSSIAELFLCLVLLVFIGVLLGNRPLIEMPSALGDVPWIERSMTLLLLTIGAFTVWDGVLAYRRLR